MLPILRREKRILLLTLAVATAAFLYYFVCDPFFREWASLSADIRLTEGRLRKIRLLLGKKMEIEGAFKKYAGPMLGKEISEGLITGTLQEVEGLAQKTQLKILEMRPLPQRQKEFFQEQGVEVSAEGTAPQFAQFIYSLLESPHALKVEKIELSSKSGQNQPLRAILIVTTITK